jgi:hypothetical protein
MAVYNLAVGGGRIKGVEFCGAFYPQNLPVCCDDGENDASHSGRRNHYFRSLNFSGEKALSCWADADKVVAGDKLILFPVHAGRAFRDVSVKNEHGCPGLSYHLEVIDLAALMANPAAPALFTLPTIDGSKADHKWQKVDANNLVYGNTFGEDADGNPCRKHLVVAMVLDALPTSNTPTTGQCVSCARAKLGCLTESPLSCINMSVTVPVEVHGGITAF